MNIDKLTYFSYLSIKHNLLLPLNKFMSFKEAILVAEKMVFRNKFFTLPFFLAATEKDIKDIKNNSIKLFFEKKLIGNVEIESISLFKKKDLIETLFKKNSFNKNHPYIDYIKSSGEFLIETKSINSKFKIKNLKNKFIGFATRNIPHKGHEKIIKHFSKKQKVLIHIFEDSSKNKKINSQKTIDSYKKFLDKNFLQKKIILKKIKLPSFLLGPRQAAVHALIAKNLNCDKFIVGRDHSGYKNFYKPFDSFKFCKKNENKIGIKILESGSPIYCNICKKIVFRKSCNCNNFIDISASLIRKLKNKNQKKILTNF